MTAIALTNIAIDSTQFNFRLKDYSSCAQSWRTGPMVLLIDIVTLLIIIFDAELDIL